MKNIFSNWNFMRVLRLALGIFIIAQGIVAQDWIFIIAGSIFSLMPILNMGCCATSSCSVQQYRKASKNISDSSYEEVL
ncbi:MAG: hypothetical protein U0T68_07500 [Ferruginibacter sp.]